MEAIEDLGGELISFYSEHIGKRVLSTDPWSCCLCATVLVDPITLGPCGHTVCKRCALRDIDSVCKKCGAQYESFNTDPMDEEASVKLSVLVLELVDKYWEKELRAVQLRNEGNKLFQRGDLEASLVKYSEAFQLNSEDHLVTSNRSHAFFMAGRMEEALEDAQRTVTLKPDWGKGYFRQGMALAATGQMEEAVVSFFQCLALEESCSAALRSEINKVRKRHVFYHHSHFCLLRYCTDLQPSGRVPAQVHGAMMKLLKIVKLEKALKCQQVLLGRTCVR